MSKPSSPRVVIVANDPLQRHCLQHALGKYGIDMLFMADGERAQRVDLTGVALWILELDSEDETDQLTEYLLDHSSAPILFGLGKAPERSSVEFPRWERRLYTKVLEHLGTLETLDDESSLTALETAPAFSAEALARSTLPEWMHARNDEPVDRVWILGASLGGPAAVKEFLDQLPAGLPVAFVYAQHIDANFSSVLARVLARHSTFRLVEAKPGGRLHYGEVTMMPVSQELVMDRDGRFAFKDKGWPGPYGPSIDQVLLNISSHYGSRCHVMIFSGMGNDGAVAAPALHAYGSRIWTQASESCANASMPDSTAMTGCAEFRGTPKQMAQRLVRLIEDECRLLREKTKPSLNGEQPHV